MKSLTKGGMIGMAMLAVSTGVTLLSDKNAYGLFLVVIGFGFVAWREWIKAYKVK